MGNGAFDGDAKLEAYLQSFDGKDIVHYLPFLSLLAEKILKFQDFDIYCIDKLNQIKRIHTVHNYIEHKIVQSSKDNT